MKKINLLLTCAALLSVLALSCSKEADPVQPASPQDEQIPEEDPQPDPSADEDVPEGMIRLNFALSHENDPAPAAEAPALPDSKTSWDGTNHSWDSGDQIRIIWGEGDSDYVDATVNNGSVSAVVADSDFYYAVYPTTATYTYTAAEGKISVSFGREQSGTFADANIMAAKTSKAAASFSFKNMTSILKFSTGASAAYNKVTFCANDKTKLNGTVSTTFGDSFTVTNTPAGTNGDLISINVAASGTYYAAILPDVTLSNGIGFKVEASSQDTGALSTAALAMDRSAVRNLGVIDNIIRKDWFIKEGGTGKGTSWEDAGGAERLVQLIYPDQSRGAGAGLTAAYRLHKATIHVAAGTYNIQAANGDAVLDPHYNTGALDFTIKGGYPANLAGTATTGYDPATNKTNFICNQAVAADRVFQLSGSNKIPNITFDGITFPANGASLAPGTAFDFNSSAASNVNFNNCYFTGFVQSGTINGGPIYVRGSGAANMSFTGCTFSNNNCNVGAAAYVYSSASTVSFTNSSFTGNVAANGGSLRARSGIVNVTDCTFTGLGIGDGDSKTANQGGALYIDGATVNILRGSISNCKANSNSGAIYYSSGSLTIDGCSISNCVSANQGGGIAMMAANKTATISNCTFSNLEAKSTSNGGGAIYNQGTMTIVNCVFDSCAAKNGAAIYCQEGTSDAVYRTVVFNSSFKSNAASGGSNSGSAPNGGCIYGNDYNSLLFANCTFSDNTVAAGGVLSIGRGSNSADHNKLYIVSSTVSGSSPAITRTSNVINVINSILAGPNNTEHNNVQKQYSIINSTLYSTLNTKAQESITFALGTYGNGVYPLNSTYSALYSAGMTVADIQGLTFANITLTQDQLNLLAKDQKGNDRVVNNVDNKIMGAYVLTTAPTE